MRQLFSANARLSEVGDYIIADITRSGESGRVLYMRFSEHRCAVYAKMELFDGSEEPRQRRVIERFPKLRNFCYSWVLSGDKNLIYALDDMDAELTCIVTEPLNIDFTPRSGEDNKETDDNEEIEDFISELYTSDRTYSGQQSYHYHHGEEHNTPLKSYKYRIGVELEVEFTTSTERDYFTEKESNWFFLERDGSLNDYGVEIITVPLHPQDAKNEAFWQGLTTYLSNNGAKSWDTSTCGLHVHIGREILGNTEDERQETLGKMLFFYHHFLKDSHLNRSIYGRSTAYNDHDGKTEEGAGAKCFAKEILHLKNVQNTVKYAMISKSNESRYFDINIENSPTVEFRKGRGSLNPKRIAAAVEWSELICRYAKHTPWMQLSCDDFTNFVKFEAKNELIKALL